jgi:methyl-accepting chemotaxis protein
MDASSDAMVSAVEEVTSVAEELRGLRDKIKQYGDASKRLSELGDVLNGLNGSIGRIQVAFSDALEHAKQTQEHVEVGRQSVERLVDSIPEVVRRIESSDVEGAIQSFSGSMKELGVLLAGHEKTLSDVVAKFLEDRIVQAVAIDELKALVERGLYSVTNLSSEVRGLQESSAKNIQKVSSLNGLVCEEISPMLKKNSESLAEVKGLVNEVQLGTNKAADGMAHFASKMLHEISLLREEVVGAKHVLEIQGKTLLLHGEVLEELAKKKKGWFN